MSTPDRQPPTIPSRKSKKTGIRLNKFIPIIIILIFATIILRDQFPQVDDYIQSILHPAQHAAVKTCRNRALIQSETPDFARIVKWGKANATQKGFLVDHLIIGEMAKDQGERLIAITCHIDASGEIVSVHRQPYEAPPPPNPPQLDYED